MSSKRISYPTAKAQVYEQRKRKADDIENTTQNKRTREGTGNQVLPNRPFDAETVTTVTESRAESTDDDVDGDETQDEDSDAELARMSKDWNAPVYAFFASKPIIEYVGRRRSHVFKCLAKGCNKRVRRFLDKGDATSTGNLRKHIKSCWGEDVFHEILKAKNAQVASEAVKSYLANGSITTAFEQKDSNQSQYSHRQHTKMETRVEIVRWVAQSGRPFDIVNDPGFLRLMKTGRPHYHIPSSMTVGRDVRFVFVRARHRLAAKLRAYEGKLSFATDTWTAPNHRSFSAVTVHLEEKGKASMIPLDIVEIPRSHTGVVLANKFKKVLDDFGIGEKILSITCDNASANDTMMDELELKVARFNGQTARAQCILHVGNLVAKTMIKQFDVPQGRKGEELKKEEEELRALAEGVDIEENETMATIGGDQERDDDTDGWVDEIALLSAHEKAEIENDLRPVRFALAKVRKLAFKIIYSTTLLLPAWDAACKEAGLSMQRIPRDVSTRWNSSFDMIHFVIKYRLAVDAVTDKRRLGLGIYALDEHEWVILEQLQDVLKILKDATLFFSRGTANLTMVILAMDYIDEVFTTGMLNNEGLDPAIHAAVGLAKKTLNKYYSLTDSSRVYRIAMILHPRHKLEYFKHTKWPADWIATAHTLTRNIYNSSYASLCTRDDEESPSDADVIGIQDLSGNIFDNLPSLTKVNSMREHDELNAYLATGIEDVAPEDALKWWLEHCPMFPHLSRMAIDYLTIPATSVDVERLFSKGRIILPYLRNRLSAQTTRALLCLGQWTKLNLVKDSDLRKAIKEVLEETCALDGQGKGEDIPDGWDKVVLPAA